MMHVKVITLQIDLFFCFNLLISLNLALALRFVNIDHF